MLVTFTTRAHGNIVFFGDVAIQLLKMMGQSGVVPGAILKENVSMALQQLESALLGEKTTTNEKTSDDNEPNVSLKHRALPLIDLLKAAASEKCDVLWQ